MATEFEVRFPLPVDVAGALNRTMDEQRLAEIMVRTESLDPVVTVSRQPNVSVVTIRRGFKGDWPEFLRSFIGERIDIHEQREWADTGHGTLSIQVVGKPVSMSGRMEMRQVGPALTETVISGTIRCSVPFVGGKVEELAKGVLTDAIRTEALVLAEG